MSAVEAVNARRMKGKGEEGEEDKCLWLKEHVRRMRREGRGRRREAKYVSYSREGACEKDEGEEGEDKCLQ